MLENVFCNLSLCTHNLENLSVRGLTIENICSWPDYCCVSVVQISSMELFRLQDFYGHRWLTLVFEPVTC